MNASSVLRWLPQAVRDRVIRAQLRELDHRALAGVTVKLAETADEIEAAARLVHAAYLARGITAPHASGVRVTPHLLLPTTMVFVAVAAAGAVVGTVSLVRDSRLGLPMDAVYTSELARLRDDGRALAEVGALSIAPALRHSGLVHLLNKVMFRVARERCGVDDLVIAVHPRAEDLYRATLLFERIGAVRTYAGLTANALAVALRLDLRTFPARALAKFGPRPATLANTHHFYMVAQHAAVRMPRDVHSVERRMPARRDAATALLEQRREALAGLPAEHRNHLLGLLGAGAADGR
jgi:hypothetical protein